MSSIIVKIIVLSIIILITLLWFLKKRKIGEIKEYFLSLYIICLTIPLQFPIFQLTGEIPTGAWGKIIYISVWNLLLIAMAFLTKEKQVVQKNNLLKWALLLLVAGLLSSLNPANQYVFGTFVGIYNFLWFIFMLTVIHSRYKPETIFSSMWKGFKIILIIQFILAIAYPVLNITEAAMLFSGEGILEMATRGERASAVGTFAHPSNLGLIVSFIFVYFATTYFLNIKRKQSLFFLVIAFMIILLTKSRTNIALAFFSFFFIKILASQSDIKKVIFRSIVFVPIVFFISYLILYYTDFGSSLFLSEDFQNVGAARFVHWFLGWEIFIDNPFFGVGLNSHLNYLYHNLVVIPGFQDWQYEFFMTNPVHNTHLIILSELGIIGGIIWLYGFYSIVKNNIVTYNYSNASEKMNKFSNIFTLIIIIIYYFYAFTGWTTTNYYVIGFMIVFLVYNKKSLYVVSTKKEHNSDTGCIKILRKYA